MRFYAESISLEPVELVKTFKEPELTLCSVLFELVLIVFVLRLNVTPHCSDSQLSTVQENARICNGAICLLLSGYSSDEGWPQHALP